MAQKDWAHHMCCRQQPRGWVVGYASLKAGWAPVLLDGWKRWVDYLNREKTSGSENICTFGQKSSDFGWLRDQNCLAQEKVLDVLVAADVFHPGEVAWGRADRVRGICSWHWSDWAAECVFTAHSFFLPPSQRGFAGTVSGCGAKPSQQDAVCPCSMWCLCLTVPCTLGSGSLCA